MIKSNLNRRLTLQGTSLVPIIVITMVALAIIAVPRLFTNSSAVTANQPLESGVPNLSAEPVETVYLITWVQRCDLPGGLCESQTGRVRVINRNDGRILRTIETGDQPDIATSPDGRYLYIAAIQESAGGAGRQDYLTAFKTKTWEVARKTKIEQPQGSRVFYNGIERPTLALSPDGSRLLIEKYAGWDSWFTVADAATGKVIADSSHLSYCVGADPKFSPDGQWLYTLLLRKQ